MSKFSGANMFAQLVEVLATGRIVQFEIKFGGYEVTVYEAHGLDHAHHGGATLAEAMNRAHASLPDEA